MFPLVSVQYTWHVKEPTGLFGTSSGSAARSVVSVSVSAYVYMSRGTMTENPGDPKQSVKNCHHAKYSLALTNEQTYDTRLLTRPSGFDSDNGHSNFKVFFFSFASLRGQKWRLHPRQWKKNKARTASGQSVAKQKYDVWPESYICFQIYIRETHIANNNIPAIHYLPLQHGRW